MCGKSIDDICKSLQPKTKKEEFKKEDSIYPGVEDTPVEEQKIRDKKLDEIHAFVDKLK